MREVAFCFGRVTLYWDTLLIALACAAGFLALWGTYGANGGKKRAFWLLVPLGLVLSLAVARTIFWYCHSEQFSSLAAALVPGSSGGFCLSGVVIGFVLAALLLRLAGLEKDTALLLDCASPALALCLALVRLSSLFSGGCRGKVPITDPRFCRLPFAAAAPGGGEYRFASFFVGALLFLVLFAVLTLLFVRRWGRRGDVFLAFLVLYSAVELVIDSTRNDASYFTFNAFISVAQILGAAAMLGVLALLGGVVPRRSHRGRQRISRPAPRQLAARLLYADDHRRADPRLRNLRRIPSGVRRKNGISQQKKTARKEALRKEVPPSYCNMR